MTGGSENQGKPVIGPAGENTPVLTGYGVDRFKYPGHDLISLFFPQFHGNFRFR